MIKQTRLVGIGVVAATALMIAGCGTTSSPTAAPKPLAVVNGQAITESDWQVAVAATNLLQGVTLPTGASAKKQQVKELASEIAVEQWALKHHLITEAKAHQEATQFLDENVALALGGTTAMQSTLKHYHLTTATLTNFLTQQMVLQAAFAQETAKVPAVSASTAEAYYKAHPSQFQTPAQVLVRHILVKQKSLAESILAQVEADHGANFAALAKKYSIDTGTKDKGGSLGWVDTGAASGFVQPFYEEMDKLKPGQFGIAHSQFGYHVIEVEAEKPATLEPFSSVESQIEQQLTQNQKYQQFQTFSNGIVKTAHVRYNL
ncbi:MAG: peptidylprolyl isomerase [Sulfobacillus sp.]|nr:peptidylprolyl isomerase [Sulfobacillus sp.]